MTATAAMSDDSQELQRACATLRERLRSGNPTRVEDLLEAYPALAEKDEAVYTLIHTEVSTRHDLGERLTLAEWRDRFPSLIRDMDDLDTLGHYFAQEMPTLSDATDAKSASSSEPARGQRPALTRVGSYQLLEEIGRGGMGVVYRARQAGLNRAVALKMILAGERAGLRDRARLRNEAEAAARLQHPNVVQIHDVGEHDGLPFLVMEYVAGGNLMHMLRGTPQAFRWAARLTETLARAIQTAHEQKIIHRDLNPSNILMTTDGIPKISDFGLAKFLLDDVGVSINGVVLGTPSYMAPEQVTRHRMGVGPFTDVYALGAILYEMLTGTPPFRGFTPMETMCQVAEAEIVPPSRLRHGVPQDLETICVKCLEKEPTRRYSSALQLAEDLRRFQENQPIEARRTSRARQVLQWARRQPLVAGLLALTALLLMAVTGLGFGYFAAENRRLMADIRNQGMNSYQNFKDGIAKGRAEEAAKALPQLQYAHELYLIKQWIDTGYFEAAQERFGQLGAQEEEHGFEWGYLDNLLNRGSVRLRGHEAPVRSVARARAGDSMVSGDDSGKVVVWNMSSDSSRECKGRHKNSVTRLAISPAGKTGTQTVASLSATPEGAAELKLWNAATGALVQSIQVEKIEARDLAFSPNGEVLSLVGVSRSSTGRTCWQWRSSPKGWTLDDSPDARNGVAQAFSKDGLLVAAGQADGTVQLRSVRDGSNVILEQRPGARVLSLTFSPDVRKLAAGRIDGSITTWDVPSLSILSHHTDRKGSIEFLEFVLDGSFLAVREGEGSLSVEFPDVRSSPRPLSSAKGRVTSSVISPDGTLLAASVDDRNIRLWELASGTLLSSYLVTGGTIHDFTFAPDGNSLLLACSDHQLRRWHFRQARDLPLSLVGHKSSVRTIDFSPDDQILASGSNDKTIKIWDRRSGRCLCVLEHHKEAVTGVAFLSSNRLVSAGMDGLIVLWELTKAPKGDSPEYTAKKTILNSHTRPYWALAVPRISDADQEDINSYPFAVGDQDGTIQIWDPWSASIKKELKEHKKPILSLAYCGSTALASSALDQTMRLWDETWHEQRRVPIEGVVTSITPFPDQEEIAGSGNDRVIHLWKLNSIDRPEFGSHPLAVRALVVHPDGRLVATACDDGMLRLWDSRNSLQLYWIRGHDVPIQTLAFTHDGTTLASADESGRIFVWNVGQLEADSKRANETHRNGEAMQPRTD